MNGINVPALILAITVVTMFSLVGIMMAYQNFLWMAIFFILGIIIMGFGIYLKVRKKPSND